MDTRTGDYPHDEWCNGDVTKQIEAGTYLKYRPTFVAWVAAGKIHPDTLAEYDAEYKESLPPEKPVAKKVVVKKAVGRPRNPNPRVPKGKKK